MNSEVDASYNVKIALLGDGGVGKTSIRRQFMGQGFKNTYTQTVGSDFSAKSIKFDYNLKNIEVNFQIWDLAGQPEFSNIRSMYYTGSQGLIFVFDLTRFDSLEHIKLWVDEVLKNNIKNVPVMLIGNKVDLESEGITICDNEDDIKIADFIYSKLNNSTLKVNNLRTSARTGENVQKAFEILGREIYLNISSKEES